MSKKYLKIDIDDSFDNKNISELGSKPLESIFLKSLKKMKWYKITIIQLLFIYLFPINFKKRKNQQLEIFIRYFNRAYNSNFHIENLDIQFYELYIKHVQKKSLYIAIYIYLIILLILLIIGIICGLSIN